MHCSSACRSYTNSNSVHFRVIFCRNINTNKFFTVSNNSFFTISRHISRHSNICIFYSCRGILAAASAVSRRTANIVISYAAANCCLAACAYRTNYCQTVRFIISRNIYSTGIINCRFFFITLINNCFCIAAAAVNSNAAVNGNFCRSSHARSNAVNLTGIISINNYIHIRT